jgi:hypothetical protein
VCCHAPALKVNNLIILDVDIDAAVMVAGGKLIFVNAFAEAPVK